MTRTTPLALVAVALLSVAASMPAAGQGSGLYDYPGGYAGRFDGVSPGAKQKGGVGANETTTIGGNRTIPARTPFEPSFQGGTRVGTSKPAKRGRRQQPIGDMR